MGIHTRDSVRQRALDHAGSVISAAEPARAVSFRRTLDLLMKDIVTHPNQEAAWTYSKLNGNGAPLEFTFSTLDDEVRYTVEIGGPDLPPVQRLEKAGELLAELGAGAAFGDLIPEMQVIQGATDLRWGAWLGVRHRRNTTEYKLYCEVPSAGSAGAERLVASYLLGAPPGPAGRAPRLVAIGQTPGSGRCEFYYYLPGLGLSRAALGALMAHVGLADRLETLWQLMQDARLSRPEAAGTLPEIEFGLSVSALPGGTAAVFSVFAFAADYVGGDALVRHQALLLAKRQGWSLGSYTAMTVPIARQTLLCAHHNVMAFIAGPAPVLGLHVSLSPPFPPIDARSP